MTRAPEGSASSQEPGETRRPGCGCQSSAADAPVTAWISPRPASKTISMSAGSAPGAIRRAAHRATACAADTPQSRAPEAQASALAVVTPTRRPVNEPGPRTTATRSAAAGAKPASAAAATSAPASSRACSPATGRIRRALRPGARAATDPTPWLVSMARTFMAGIRGPGLVAAARPAGSGARGSGAHPSELSLGSSAWWQRGRPVVHPPRRHGPRLDPAFGRP